MAPFTHSSGSEQQDAASAWFSHEAAFAALDEAPSHRQVVMIERSAAEGSMAPLHRRDEDERYRVIEGAVTFYIGAEVITAETGDVVVAPRGAARTFRVESGAARWRVLTRVASLQRYEDFARAICPPVESPADGWPSPEEESAVAAIAEANGIELIGPPGLLPEGS
ncbi:MAG TPA: cupin domain-containing protein [Thermoleophilaceae bacterium]